MSNRREQLHTPARQRRIFAGHLLRLDIPGCSWVRPHCSASVRRRWNALYHPIDLINLCRGRRLQFSVIIICRVVSVRGREEGSVAHAKNAMRGTVAFVATKRGRLMLNWTQRTETQSYEHLTTCELIPLHREHPTVQSDFCDRRAFSEATVYHGVPVTSRTRGGMGCL